MDHRHDPRLCIYEGGDPQDCGCNCDWCVANHRPAAKRAESKDTKLLHAGSLRK
jgi:hypothetical protein